jgi:hypothetical protein
MERKSGNADAILAMLITLAAGMNFPYRLTVRLVTRGHKAH